MNYYKLLKVNSLISNPRIKFFGLYLLHKLNKRYLSVNFDPVNACNLRCQMCYFSDQEYAKKLKGIFRKEDLELLSKAILSRALKLQVGCGTEPTLYRDLETIFGLASKYGVPYISLTTNANLIEKAELIKWVLAGLNEITVSLHGVTEQTYQLMMINANYKRFFESLAYITEIKKQYPLNLRVNYTFNEDNFDELKDFWQLFENIDIDILQIRPITQLGNSAYKNFSLKKIIPNYETIYNVLLNETQKRKAIFIAPTKEQLLSKQSTESLVRDYTYCYISPAFFWRNDFDWRNETFNQYTKRTAWSKELFKMIFASRETYKALENKTLNYNVV